MQSHWKDASKLIYVSDGLDAMIEAIREHDITSVALPALGCGLGGLNWSVVKELLIEKVTDCSFIIFEPR